MPICKTCFTDLNVKRFRGLTSFPTRDTMEERALADVTSDDDSCLSRYSCNDSEDDCS